MTSSFFMTTCASLHGVRLWIPYATTTYVCMSCHLSRRKLSLYVCLSIFCLIIHFIGRVLRRTNVNYGHSKWTHNNLVKYAKHIARDFRPIGLVFLSAIAGSLVLWLWAWEIHVDFGEIRVKEPIISKTWWRWKVNVINPSLNNQHIRYLHFLTNPLLRHFYFSSLFPFNILYRKRTHLLDLS